MVVDHADVFAISPRLGHARIHDAVVADHADVVFLLGRRRGPAIIALGPGGLVLDLTVGSGAILLVIAALVFDLTQRSSLVFVLVRILSFLETAHLLGLGIGPVVGFLLLLGHLGGLLFDLFTVLVDLGDSGGDVTLRVGAAGHDRRRLLKVRAGFILLDGKSVDHNNVLTVALTGLGIGRTGQFGNGLFHGGLRWSRRSAVDGRGLFAVADRHGRRFFRCLLRGILLGSVAGTAGIAGFARIRIGSRTSASRRTRAARGARVSGPAGLSRGGGGGLLGFFFFLLLAQTQQLLGATDDLGQAFGGIFFLGFGSLPGLLRLASFFRLLLFLGQAGFFRFLSLLQQLLAFFRIGIDRLAGGSVLELHHLVERGAVERARSGRDAGRGQRVGHIPEGGGGVGHRGGNGQGQDAGGRVGRGSGHERRLHGRNAGQRQRRPQCR